MPSAALPTVIARRPLTDALLTQLRAGAVTPDGTQLLVGDGHVPAVDDNDTPATPYAILYELPATLDGPPADAQADGAFAYQVTSVGLTRAECGGMADLIRQVLTGTTQADVGTLRVLRVESGGDPGVTRVGSLYQAPESFTVYVSSN